jgi:hypothetical protein
MHQRKWRAWIVTLLSMTILACGGSNPPQVNPDDDTKKDGGTQPLPDGGTQPLPDGGTQPLPDGGTQPLPDGGTQPLPDGGTQPLPDGGTQPLPDGGTHALQFTQVACVPDVSRDVVQGQTISCTFRVVGTTMANATLRCRDAASAPVDCSSTSSTQLQPFGSNALPINDGLFIMSTQGRAGTHPVIVWVADTGALQATHRFEANIVADDGVNGPPSIEFNCAGDADGTVRVVAGAQLVCQVRLSDPDPDTLSWSYTQTAGSVPANEPTPFGGSGQAPLEFTWRWSTVAAEAGASWTYRFTVNDGTAPAVTRDLAVSVE